MDYLRLIAFALLSPLIIVATATANICGAGFEVEALLRRLLLAAPADSKERK